MASTGDAPARHRLTVPSGADPLASSSSSPNNGSGRKRGGKLSAASVIGSPLNYSSSSNAALWSSSNYRSTSHYLARLVDFRQLDVQSALDQMRTLLSARPNLVYKTSYYRKQTKNHWARDDPAFCVLQVLFLVLASIAHAVSFRVPVFNGVVFLLSSVMIHWGLLGVLVATACRSVAHQYLMGSNDNKGGGYNSTGASSSLHVRQSVEWWFAFDIHCNAFFPVFVLLYGVQFFLLPLVLGTGFVALLVSNTLYAAALSWYWYITHLGYRALPFLSQTEVFLFPIAAILLVYALNLIGYPFNLGWNASRLLAHVYFD